MSEEVSLNDLSRAELNAKAEEMGIESPEALQNKDAVIEAINGVDGGEEGGDANDTKGTPKTAKPRKATGSAGHATGFDATGNPTFK